MCIYYIKVMSIKNLRFLLFNYIENCKDIFYYLNNFQSFIVFK